MKRTLLAVLLLISFPVAYAQQYGWVRVAQVGNANTTLKAVEFVDSLHGWLYGSGVNYMYTLDGGTSWVQAVSPGFAATSISMVDTLRGWTVGNGFNEGGIGRTTDGGRTWIQQRLRLDRAYNGTASLRTDKNITSGRTRNFSPDTSNVVQTADGGVTWTERTILDSLMDLRIMQFIDSLHGWIVGGSPLNGVYAVLRTVDGGTNWQVIRTVVGYQAVSFTDSVNGWSVKRDSPTYCFKTSDGGITWTQLGRIEDPMWGDLTPIGFTFVDSLNGWTFGSMFYWGDVVGMIYRTTDGGVSWYREHLGGSRGFGGMMLDRTHGWAIGTAGSVYAYKIVSSAPERMERMAKSFALRQNYPNPFNPSTTIEYEVVTRERVAIQLYDAQGKEVRTLVNSEHERGVYRLRFDATGLASGVYFYTMKTSSFTETRQMIIIR